MKFDPKEHMKFPIQYEKCLKNVELIRAGKLFNNHCWFNKNLFNSLGNGPNYINFSYQAHNTFYLYPEKNNLLQNINVSSNGRNGKLAHIDLKMEPGNLEIRINNTNYTLLYSNSD